jgi:hypothetical protein
MPLPVLESSKYETTIPSSGKKIAFRPFLVKEEKILLLAQESGDSESILSALKDIIYACTFEKVTIDELAIYDLEFLFLQLRARSVGEVVDLQIKCKSCESINALQINLADVKVSKPRKKVDSKIQLTDDVGVIVRTIPIADIGKVSDKPEDFVKMLALCIESIYDDANVYNHNDVSEKELTEFVESLSRPQVQKIEEFIANQPKLSHKESYTCHECGKTHKIEMAGLQDFFQ